MMRKRLTEQFPCLLPLRKRQRAFCYYLKMRFDGIHYATNQSSQTLPYQIFSSCCPMYNTQTGFPMVYQENKVHNLKLAAKKLNGLIIEPGETFSFWNRVRDADKKIPYKDALTERNGTLTTEYGGGLCQISNLLCWICLHSPLSIIERHGHYKKDFPEPPSDAPMGVDATVSEGWLDFRVRNDTDVPIQILITFDETHIIGQVFSGRDMGKTWQVVNQNLNYYREPNGIFEEVDIVQRITENSHIFEKTAYRNRCQIAYCLPEGTTITEKGEKNDK